MNQPTENVIPLGKQPTASNGGNGHRTRLAVVETQLKAVESNLEKTDARLTEVEKRLGALESGMAEVRTRLQSIATKEDVEKAKNTVVLWVIGIAASVIGSGFFMALKLSSG